MKEVDVQIRRAHGVEDYQACVELQKRIWGFTEAQDIAALPVLMIANRMGGNVLVAQDPSGTFIGFSFAFPGWHSDRRPLWWSHMTAVVEEYRHRNIGLRLKIRQREEALAEGVDEIHWTYDPLQAMNAHFNIHKLGAVVRTYEENIYGSTSSALHQGLPTDRFVAEWRLNSSRVKEVLGLAEPSVIMRDLDRLPRINPGGQRPNLQLDDSPLLLQIPFNLNELKQTGLAAAREWQENVRTASMHYFSAGFAVTDFLIIEKPDPQALYVLEKNV